MKSQTFQARSDLALAATTVVGVRWSSILFEKPDAMSRAFPDRAVFELLQPRAQADGFAFDVPAPAPDRHVFAGLCAGLGEEMCTDPQWKKTEADPRYALGVLVLIPADAAGCTYAALSRKDDSCGESRPLAVSRFLLLYVYRAFSPAEDPFMSSKWPWTLPATLTPGFHVIEYRSRQDSRKVAVDQLEFDSDAALPNLF